MQRAIMMFSKASVGRLVKSSQASRDAVPRLLQSFSVGVIDKKIACDPPSELFGGINHCIHGKHCRSSCLRYGGSTAGHFPQAAGGTWVSHTSKTQTSEEIVVGCVFDIAFQRAIGLEGQLGGPRTMALMASMHGA